MTQHITVKRNAEAYSVSEEISCSQCNGTGKIPGSEILTCTECFGSGSIKKILSDEEDGGKSGYEIKPNPNPSNG